MRKGFTLLELVVAIAIVLLIGATVSPILLQHLKDAKVATVNENLTNIKAAFESWYTKEAGVIKDANGDGNYLDDLVNAGWLTKSPTDPNFDYEIIRADDGSGHYAYSIRIKAASDDVVSTASEILQALDEKVDDGNATGGGFEYSTGNSTANTYGCYLLYKDPNFSGDWCVAP